MRKLEQMELYNKKIQATLIPNNSFCSLPAKILHKYILWESSGEQATLRTTQAEIMR